MRHDSLKDSLRAAQPTADDPNNEDLDTFARRTVLEARVEDRPQPLYGLAALGEDLVEHMLEAQARQELGQEVHLLSHLYSVYAA